MKVYTNGGLSAKQQNGLVGCFSDIKGGQYRLENGRFIVQAYGTIENYGYVPFIETPLLVVEDKTNSNGILSPLDNAIQILDENNKSTECDALTRYLYMYSTMVGHNGYVVSAIDRYKKRKFPTILLKQLATNDLFEYELDRKWEYMTFRMTSDGVIGRKGGRHSQFAYFDLKLNLLWVFDDGKETAQAEVQYGLEFEGFLLFNAGATVKGRASSNGSLLALNKLDGTIIWQCDFPWQVDQLEKESEQTFIALSAEKLYRVDAQTGKVLAEVDTGFTNITQSHLMLIVDEYLFALSKEDRLMQIYSLENLELLKTFTTQEYDWRFVGMPKIIDRSLYISVAVTGYQSGLAILDLDTLDLTPEFEVEPNFHINVPTEEYAPITLEANNVYFGDVLRLVEGKALQLANDNGNEGRGLESNKYFNGTLQLTCKNLLETDGFDMQAVFARLKQRIEHEAKSWGMRCGLGKQPIVFDVVFED